MNKNNISEKVKKYSTPTLEEKKEKESDLYKRLMTKGGSVLFVYETDKKNNPISSQRLNISDRSFYELNPKTHEERLKTPHEFFKMLNGIKLDLGAKFFDIQPAE